MATWVRIAFLGGFLKYGYPKIIQVIGPVLVLKAMVTWIVLGYLHFRTPPFVKIRDPQEFLSSDNGIFPNITSLGENTWLWYPKMAVLKKTATNFREAIGY